MEILKNTYRGTGLDVPILENIPAPSADATVVQQLLARCPDAAVTPMVDATTMASAMNVAQVSVKDERARMGLGSFKALGAAYVIAHAAIIDGQDMSDVTFTSATAGNHGLSIAAGARAFGAKAVIFIAAGVPEAFADRLKDLGAEVIRAGADYQGSLDAALEASEKNGWTLLSDTSWPEYYEMSHRLMEGYTALMDEANTQMTAPTHVFLQAGVGGLAGAGAVMVRKLWGDAPIVTVVEPANATAIHSCIAAGDFVSTTGPDSCMGRLDCKEASLIALKGLAKDADFFALITEDEGVAGSDFADAHGMTSTPSGAGGLAGLLASGDHRDALGLTDQSHVLIILSEGPE